MKEVWTRQRNVMVQMPTRTEWCHLLHYPFNNERPNMLMLTIGRNSKVGNLYGIEERLEPIGAVSIGSILRTWLGSVLHLFLDNLRQTKVMLVKTIHSNDVLSVSDNIHLTTTHPKIVLQLAMDKIIHRINATRKIGEDAGICYPLENKLPWCVSITSRLLRTHDGYWQNGQQSDGPRHSTAPDGHGVQPRGFRLRRCLSQWAFLCCLFLA